MTYFLDTNILLHLIRESELADKMDKDLGLLDPTTNLVVSAVTEGEIRSIVIQNKWGTKKREKLEKLLKDTLIVPVEAKDIILRYAEIDAYSQGKLDGTALPSGLSSRNMGKNDLWIAATASVLEAKLLTTDADFDHLKDVFLDVEKFA